MIGTTMIVQHRNEHENDMQGQAFEVSHGQIQLAHRDRGGDLAIERSRLKGIRHVGSAYGIEDDIEKIGASFSADIKFITPTKTMERAEILDFLTALYRGFPDWRYDNDPPILCEDDRYGVKWRQGGTHTATLEFPGFDAYAATDRRVTIPEHYFFYRVDDQGLCEIHPDPVPGGAPRGIFEQIGVELPPL